MTTFVVFVKSIIKDFQRVIVVATNGGDEGPPSVAWELPISEVKECFIGKKYRVTIEKAE